MYKRLSVVMFPVLLLFMIGGIVWGYQQNQAKNTMMIKAENQYQRAFHDLSFYVDKLHTELGSALAVNDTSQAFHRKCLVQVWRLTSQAQSEINQLPLSWVPLAKTEEFLAQIAKFSYKAAIHNLNSGPLSPDELKTLTELHERSKEISKEMRQVQGKILSQKLRWIDVENTLIASGGNMDNSIVHDLESVDKRVKEYSEVNWGPSMPRINQQRNFTALADKQLSGDEIKQIAFRQLGQEFSGEMQVMENGPGTDYHTYTVAIASPDRSYETQMEYTTGGELIWFMAPRDVTEKRLSLAQARERAQDFLSRLDFPEMEAVSYDEDLNVVNITMARKKDGVVIYPERLTVKVAMDNGEITGFQDTDYLFENKNDRKIEAPKLTAEEAKTYLNPKFKISDEGLAVIKNDFDDEVLCYQYLGQINGSAYRIFLNAESGLEEKIEEIDTGAEEASA